MIRSLLSFLPVDLCIDGEASIPSDFFNPSGVNSKAHAIIRAIGKPIKTNTIVVVANHPGNDNGSSMAVTI